MDYDSDLVAVLAALLMARCPDKPTSTDISTAVGVAMEIQEKAVEAVKAK